MDQFETQFRVMQQSNAMQAAIQDLYRWEKDMKQNENLSHQTAVASESFDSEFPIRSEAAPPAESITSKNAATNGPASKKTPAVVVKTPSTLEKANEFKTRGNDCVKAGQFQKAIHYYTEAIRLNKFDAVYFSNRAHCYLKLNRYLECVEDCTIAIGMDENCVKAYYRRMQAHEQLNGNLAAALSDCETVLRFEPKNSEAKKSLERIKSALKGQKAPAATAVSKSQIEKENILLRASNGTGASPAASAPSVKTAPVTWSKYENQNEYERIDYISKPPHLRSKQPLKRMEITEATEGPLNGAGDAPPTEEIRNELPKKSVIRETPATVEYPKPADDATTESKIVTNSHKPQSHSLPTPKSTTQFHKTWQAANSDQQKYAVLKSIYNGDVAKLLGSQFEAALLTDILRILKHHFVVDHQPIVNIMHGIVNNMEMSIVALLMNDEDRLAFTKLLAYMRSIEEDADRTNAIDKKFESFLLPSK